MDDIDINTERDCIIEYIRFQADCLLVEPELHNDDQWSIQTQRLVAMLRLLASQLERNFHRSDLGREGR